MSINNQTEMEKENLISARLTQKHIKQLYARAKEIANKAAGQADSACNSFSRNNASKVHDIAAAHMELLEFIFGKEFLCEGGDHFRDSTEMIPDNYDLIILKYDGRYAFTAKVADID